MEVVYKEKLENFDMSFFESLLNRARSGLIEVKITDEVDNVFIEPITDKNDPDYIYLEDIKTNGIFEDDYVEFESFKRKFLDV